MGLDGLASITAQDWQRPVCYGCGPDNPHSLGADFRFDVETGEVRFRHKMRGFEHGAPGALATIMDEAQGALCHHIGHLILTDQLVMKYKKAVKIDQVFDVRCWVTAVRKRRMYTRGTMTDLEGELLVTSSATWFLLPDRMTRRMFKDHMNPGEIELLAQQIENNRKRAREIRHRIREKK